MVLAARTRLGPYEILSLLGAGGMGEVYRARDTRLERTVAIKILSQLSYDPAHKQRFEREARAISSLNHPNICTLHDIGHQDGIDYLVMECVEGETLTKRLEKGPLSVDQVLKVGAQIADALDKAHRSGIVHRDVKPNNIVLTPTGAKLLDFGLAKPTSALVDVAAMTATKVETPVTERGTIVGTFQYMSPEQVEGRELDGRSDIFSLGAVLYEMVTGQHAFEGESRLSVASAILEKEPAPITTIKPLAPAALDHTIRTCLAKDPNDRWQTALDLSHELKWIGESGSQAGVLAVPGRGSRIMRERIAWAAAAAVLLCALAAVGVMFHLKKDAPPAPNVRAMIPPPADNQFGAFAWNRFLPALSPDGRQLVVPVMDTKGKLGLWLRGLNDLGQGKILPGTEEGAFPFWSPDSRSIGFFSPGKLKRIDIEGDLVQVLAEVTSSPRGGTWGSSGIILYTPGTSSELYQIPASGGTPRKVTERITSLKELSHRWPTFLADGKHFLFFVTDQEQPDVQGVYAGSLDTKAHHLVVKTSVGPAYESGETIVYARDGAIVTQPFDERKLVVSGEPVAMPDQVAVNVTNNTALFSVSSAGNLVYYPAPSEGPFALSWYDRDGRRGDTLDTGPIRDIALSPDGTRVAVGIYNPNGLNRDLWSYDVSRGTKTRLTSSLEDEASPVWQPDGQFVLFTSGFGGNQSRVFGGNQSPIYRTRSDGNGGVETVLRSEGVDEWPGSICHDGRYLAYTRSTKDSPTSVWILPLTGDHKPFALIQTQFSNFQPVFSPDCKWIAYVSSQNTGRPEVYLANFPDATHRYQVSTQSGALPHWRGDSKELFYYSYYQNSMIAVSVEEKGGEISLGAARPLFPLSSPYSTFFNFDVTPDGKRFLISTVNFPTASIPLTLVTNWKAELKKK
jgi:Tol biopolymer transport system component